MSTTILNFKKVEIVAESKEAAIAQVEENLFHINGDATQAYKNWKSKQSNGVTERGVKEFMLDYLEKKGKSCPGAGYLITVESSVADTRERPYRIENVKGEGKRKYKTTYVAMNDNGTVDGKWDTNKADALNAIKEMYKNDDFKGCGNLVMTKEVVEGQAVVARYEYAPSKNTKNGTWICFGIEK
jgi:hypothetical protein